MFSHNQQIYKLINSQMEKELFKLSWLNWVTSNSWEASKINIQNQQVDYNSDRYQTWPATRTTATLINNNNNKNKKKKRGWEHLKTWVGIFQVGNFWVGIFRRENLPEERLIGGNFRVGIFRTGVFMIPRPSYLFTV